MEHVIVAVVAIGKNRELGNADKLLWHIPEDLKRFKQLTSGHPVIMGRKTFESIVGYLKKPLPNRSNIVVTRDSNYSKALAERHLQGVLVASSLEEAIGIAKEQPGAEEIHIGGGAQLYAQALPRIDRLHLTIVEDSPKADTFFPEYEGRFTEIASQGPFESGGISYRWVDFNRIDR